MISIDYETFNAALTKSLNSLVISSERKAAEAYLQQIKSTHSKEIFVMFINYIALSFSTPLSSSPQVDNNQLQNEANTQLVLSLLSDWLQVNF